MTTPIFIDTRELGSLYVDLLQDSLSKVITQIFHQDIREPAGPIRPRPRNRRWREPTPSLQMLAAIPEIGPAQAAALLERFSTIAKVLSATTDELRKVHRVGRQRVES